MKKTLVLFLAFLLIFALIGCNTAANTEGNTTDTTAATGNETAAAETEGTAERYEIVYLCPSFTVEWPLGMVTQIAKYEDKYNFDLIAADSEADNETYVTLLETYCDQGVDGFILMTLPDLQQRCYEICRDAGIPMIYDAIAFTDADGKLMTAGAEMNATDFGEQCCQWIVDNYQTYWDDVDQSTLGFIAVTYSTMQSMIDRAAGATQVFTENFPDCPNVFTADLLSEGTTSIEAAYNVVAPILSAHPEIEHWAVVAVQDVYAQGAARALEGNDFGTDKALVASVGGENLVTEWDAGYEGVWVAADYCSPIAFTMEELPALMSVVTGEKELTDLWPEWKTGDNEYASLKLSGYMVTKDTYQEAMAEDEAAIEAAIQE